MGFDIDDKTDNDDDIIELTEVIEKGTAVASTPSSSQEDIFGPAMSDLGNAKAPDLPPDMDVDLDALLAQMDSDGGFSHLEEMERAKAAEAQSASEQNASEQKGAEDDGFDLDAMIAQAENSVAPAQASAATSGNEDETLPDMADIDALLAEMDMPEQPADDAPVASAPPTEQNAAQMDDLLENIFDEAPAKAKPAQSEDASADLDALFNSVLNDEPAPAAPQTSATEEIFQEKEAVTPEVSPATQAAVDVSDMYFGEEKTPSSAPAEELDALFQDVLGDASLSAADVAKAVVEVQAKDDTPAQEPDMELLDTLFGNDAPAQKAEKPENSMPSGDQLAQEASHVADEALAFMQDPPPMAPSMSEVDDVWASSAAVASAVAAPVVAAEMTKAKTADPVQKASADSATVQRVQSLEERLTLLEEHVAESLGATEAKFTASLQDSQGQMGSLQEEIQALREQFTAQEQRLSALEEHMQATEVSLAATHAAHTPQPVQEDDANKAQEEQLDSLSTQLGTLTERMLLVEENSQAVARDAMARDVAAREALSSYIEKLECVAKEAVERESEAQSNVHGIMERLEQALQAQEQLSITYAQRLTELEDRLQSYEKNMQQSVEKVAAAAAAKVLREEIAALLAE